MNTNIEHCSCGGVGRVAADRLMAPTAPSPALTAVSLTIAPPTCPVCGKLSVPEAPTR